MKTSSSLVALVIAASFSAMTPQSHAQPAPTSVTINTSPITLAFTSDATNTEPLSTIACQGANCVATSVQRIYTSAKAGIPAQAGQSPWTSTYAIQGDTWGAGGEFQDLKAGGPGEFVAVGIAGKGGQMYNVWTSTDSGANWTPQGVNPTGSVSSIEWKELAYNTGNGFVAFGNPVGTGSDLYYATRSTAYSSAWTAVQTKQFDVPTGVTWPVPFTCVMVAQNGDIYASTLPSGPCGQEDMSVNLRVQAGTQYGIFLRDIHYLPANPPTRDMPLYIAVGYRSSGGAVMVSPDRLTWYYANTDFSLLSVACSDDGKCLAVSDLHEKGLVTTDGYNWRVAALQGKYNHVAWSKGDGGNTPASFIAVGSKTTRYPLTDR